MKVKLAYQVYSAREEAEKDLRGVLRKLAAIGYDGVELAGAYGNSAADIADMLKETGLVAISSHVPMDAILADEEGTIAFYQTIGCAYIAIPFLDEKTRPGAAGFARTLQAIRSFGEKCRAAGITLLYHNHDFEFDRVSGQYGLDFLYDAIPAEYLETEIDTCWVNVAGENPAEYVKKYANRCPVIHLKDFVGEKQKDEQLFALINTDGSDDKPVKKQDAPSFAFRPVGYGVQDIPAIIRAGLAGGAKWFVVEQDSSLERPPLEAAQMSCDYVRSLEG